MGLLIREMKVKPVNKTQGWMGWMDFVLEDQMCKCVFEDKQWTKIYYSLMSVPVYQAEWNQDLCLWFI